MNITIILPMAKSNKKAIGGFKVIYQYANYLCKQGFDITIYYDCRKRAMKFNGLLRFLLMPVYKYRIKGEPQWFELDEAIKRIAVVKVSMKHLINSDVIIATTRESADYLSSIKPLNGEKFYFIQDFENWGCTDEDVFATYRYGYHNIAVSKWLQKIVQSESGEKCSYIPNGIDFDKFGLDNPIEGRNPKSISMMYRSDTRKGASDGIQVLLKLQQIYPDINIVVFGVESRPKCLPEWIKYIEKADQAILRKIYNETAIFLCTSLQEGFGLTGAESMSCGCALVSTNTQGVNDYAIPGENVLLSDIHDVDSLVSDVKKLIDNNEFRISLAQSGYKSIRKLSINTSQKLLEKTIRNFYNERI